MGNDIPFIKRSCDTLFPTFSDIFKEAETYKASIFELSLPMTPDVVSQLKLYSFVPVVKNKLYVQLNKNSNMMVIACDTNYDYKNPIETEINEEKEEMASFSSLAAEWRSTNDKPIDKGKAESYASKKGYHVSYMCNGLVVQFYEWVEMEKGLLVKYAEKTVNPNFFAPALKRQRDAYVDLLTTVFVDFCDIDYLSNGTPSGWLDCKKNPSLIQIGDLLVSLGKFEQNQTFPYLYKRR